MSTVEPSIEDSPLQAANLEVCNTTHLLQETPCIPSPLHLHHARLIHEVVRVEEMQADIRVSFRPCGFPYVAKRQFDFLALPVDLFSALIDAYLASAVLEV